MAAAWVLLGLHIPITEDSLFWWVPKGLLHAQEGPGLVYAGPLPERMANSTAALVPQWTAGVPDYQHPPLWYAWLGTWLGVWPTVVGVHLACLLPAIAAATGATSLARTLGRPWAGLLVFALPPFLAQLWRPELDLPLLGMVLWALCFALRAQWWRFALLGLLAPWCKEPGVILAAAGVLAALHQRTLHPLALVPLLGLGTWALAHGGLADPERLPTDLAQWLHDLGVAGRLWFIEQGRWLMFLGVVPLVRHRPLGPHLVCAAFALVWLLFFSSVGFFGGTGVGFTHVRYFLPGLVVWALVLGSRWPWLALLGLAFLRTPSPYGPEANLWGADAAWAERQSNQAVADWVAEGQRVWVGSYQAAGLSQPWSGQHPTAVLGVQVYGPDTDPAAFALGDRVVVAAYGEPAGVVRRSLQLSEVQRWQSGHAQVVAHVVVGRKQGQGR